MNDLNCKRKGPTDWEGKEELYQSLLPCWYVFPLTTGLVSQFDLYIKALRRRGVNFIQCPADYY